ncbi:MAG: hypothetical protein EA379_01480 [Phycisphaerales bacterium]|nr:MAG: hypothetical protein EA379_01480 [Phycisphaerales bacterium]
MTPATTRLLGAGLLAASLLALFVIMPEMVRRLRVHNLQAEYVRYAFSMVDTPDFNFAGLPVTIREIEQRGDRLLEITWRGESTRIRMTGRSDDRLPDLVKYEDWLQVYEIAEIPPRDVEPAERTPTRLVIVARHPPHGGEVDTWAVTARREWVYELVQLLRPDDEQPQPLPEPVPDPTRRAPSVPPVSDFSATDAFARWTFNFVALPEYQRTWHYSAALGVTPRLKYPRNQFTDDGMSAMNWTWPAAGAAILGLLAGGALLGASTIRR